MNKKASHESGSSFLIIRSDIENHIVNVKIFH